ncbi:hypothetical protein [Halalkalibacter krulwichiae]|uniref:Uncharacterized protein n=1 Tax=Halalkalibacter krulwichiae TaxID=199441 RepID=A0A1X9MGR3_9BACI|nr:hypothetical protein [Halalkalibacter krulwichiae]ARK29622.1 hypothetical protein BkAM31D_06965 [Halalkalibacter krulwichiae]
MLKTFLITSLLLLLVASFIEKAPFGNQAYTDSELKGRIMDVSGNHVLLLIHSNKAPTSINKIWVELQEEADIKQDQRIVVNLISNNHETEKSSPATLVDKYPFDGWNN